MGVLSGYLRFQIVVVTAVLMAIGAVGVLTVRDETVGFLALVALVIACFVGLVALFSLR